MKVNANIIIVVKFRIDNQIFEKKTFSMTNFEMTKL